MIGGRLLAGVAAALALAAGFSALSQATAPRPVGYLAGAAFDGAALIGPPPAEDSDQGRAERSVYEATRSLAGTPRWAQAAADADLTPANLFAGFGCAAGVSLSAEETPAFARLSGRVLRDIGAVVSPTKDRFQRPRPSLGDDEPICVAREPALMASGSYPSGHAMLGWTWALLLAELVPDRADAILLRGREFGDSRVVCGVHYPSDIEAGRTLAAALVARLHAEPQFTADMAAARAELARAGPAQCLLRKAG